MKIPYSKVKELRMDEPVFFRIRARELCEAVRSLSDNTELRSLAKELDSILQKEGETKEDTSYNPKEVMTILEDVRDLLGKQWHSEALKYIEDVLAFNPELGRRMDPLPYLGAFESAFRTACRKHNVIAGFVIVEKHHDKAENKEYVKLHTGGHHIADAVLSYHLRPLADKLGKDINPQKPYLEVMDIERRHSFNVEAKPIIAKSKKI